MARRRVGVLGHPARLCHEDLIGSWIVVRAPRAGSSAEQAGLRHGDVILAVNGQEVSIYQEMAGRMREHQPDERVEPRIRRGVAEPQELVVTR